MVVKSRKDYGLVREGTTNVRVSSRGRRGVVKSTTTD